VTRRIVRRENLKRRYGVMTSTSTIVNHSASRAKPSPHRVAIAGVAGWLAATVAIEAYAAAGRAAGVPMQAGAPWAHSAQHLTTATFGVAVFICTLMGTVLAVLVARFSDRPARTFVATAVLLTAASLVEPLGAAHTAGSTKLFLACGHVIAAAIIVPVLARQLPSGRAHRPA
jgi:hypothetical protein